MHMTRSTPGAANRRKRPPRCGLFFALVLLGALVWTPIQAFAQPNPALLDSLSRVQTPRLDRNQSPVERLLAQVEADRLLLSELRKPIPVEREAAEEYLRRIRDLAATSDPISLSLLANTVLQQAPYYFDWAEKEFDNADQRALEYYVGGARGFHLALEDFKRGVLLTVINHLEALSELVLESTEEQSQF